MAKFLIAKSSGGSFYFNLKANNGETILTSEMYSSKSACESGISSVRVNSQLDSRYKRFISTNYKRYFTLVGANGETIGTSEMYESYDAREVGIASVKSVAPSAIIQDITSNTLSYV